MQSSLRHQYDLLTDTIKDFKRINHIILQELLSNMILLVRQHFSKWPMRSWEISGHIMESANQIAYQTYKCLNAEVSKGDVFLTSQLNIVAKHYENVLLFAEFQSNNHDLMINFSTMPYFCQQSDFSLNFAQILYFLRPLLGLVFCGWSLTGGQLAVQYSDLPL